MNKFLLLFASLIVCLFTNPTDVVAESIKYSCEFNFVLEARFPCPGSQRVDGDGLARFNVSLSEKKKNGRKYYLIRIKHSQPAVYSVLEYDSKGNLVPTNKICMNAVNSEERVKTFLSRDSNYLKFKDENGTVILKLPLPLKSTVTTNYRYSFGYSGGSSIESKTTGKCEKIK